MSIIYEALKKTQQTLKLPPLSDPTSQKKRTLVLIFAGLGAVSIVLLILAAFLILYTPTPRSAAPVHPGGPVVTPQTSTAQAPQRPEAPKQASEQKPAVPASTTDTLPQFSFQLNGIIYMNREYNALIDGRILKTGDFIEGMQVSEITEKSATLKLGEKTITLKLK